MRVWAGDKELDKDNASVAVVGKGHAFTIIEGDALKKYLDAIEVSACSPTQSNLFSHFWVGLMQPSDTWADEEIPVIAVEQSEMQ